MKKTLRNGLLCLLVLVVLGGSALYLRPVECFKQVYFLHESLSGIESGNVTMNGERMHYLVEGPKTGTPIVLVHGLGGNAEDWRALAPVLAKAGYRVYMPELFGFGRSAKPASFSYAVHDQAAAVVQFMDAVGLHQVDLAGWSMGGGIVQHVAFQRPEQIRKLVLFDSVGIWTKLDWDPNLFVPKNENELAQIMALLDVNPKPTPSFIARDVLRIAANEGWVYHRALDMMLTGVDATDSRLPQLKMPVLLVWGSLDRITPIALGQRIHQLVPQSEIYVAEGCGHRAPLQCVPQYSPTLLSFLGSK